MHEMQETRVWSLGQEDPLEEEMATHSSLLVWWTPWMEEPSGLQFMGSQRVGHHWATEHARMYPQSKSHPSLLLIPRRTWSCSGMHIARCSWGGDWTQTLVMGTSASTPTTQICGPGWCFVLRWLCTQPMINLGEITPLLILMLGFSLSFHSKWWLFILPSLIRWLTPSVHTFNTINFSIYIQHSIY